MRERIHFSPVMLLSLATRKNFAPAASRTRQTTGTVFTSSSPMKIQRRDFLKTSLAVSATAALGSQVQAASLGPPATGGRAYFKLRAKKRKPPAPRPLLDGYLEKALTPAVNQRGIKNVGVFTEVDVNKNAG